MILTTGDVIQGNMNSTNWKLHGWGMWICWSVLGYIMLVSNRYLKRYYLLNFWMHSILGTIIFLETFALGLYAISNLSWKISNYVHTIMGFIVLCLVGILVIGGLLTRYL